MGDENSSSSEGSTIVSVTRQDGWANPETGMGMPGVDSRIAWVPYARRRDEQRLRNLWLGEGLAGRIVEHPADEMTRERGKVELGEGFTSEQEQLGADIDELDVWSKFKQVIAFDRAYGGGALIVAVDDGLPWDQPVDMARIERVTAIHTATPNELLAERYFNDPMRPNFGKPALYRWLPMSLPGIDGYGMTNRLVHASRVIAFTGLDVDNTRFVENGGWGDSVLARCEERIRDTAAGLSGLGVSLTKFAQDVVKTPNLAKYLGDKRGKEALGERVSVMKQTQSILGLLLLGDGEEYQRQGIPMGGVADVLHELGLFLCATSSMPMVVLMGTAEAGLGDQGSSQIRQWHDWCRAQQNNRIRPNFNRLVKLMLRAKEGPTRGVEPPRWQLEFNPLVTPTPEQEDARRKTQAEIDNIYLTHGVQRAQHIARHRFTGPKGFNPVTPPDPMMTSPAVDVGEEGQSDDVPPIDVTGAVEEVVDAPRVDASHGYVQALVREVEHGMDAEEAERWLKKRGLDGREARQLMKLAKVQRLDAKVTNFPRPGDNRRVALASSRFGVFDPAYAKDLEENWPEVWALSSNPLGNRQFQRLYPLARSGKAPDTALETHAVQFREEWARRNAGKERPAGVVSLVKWLVVGRMGEARMKQVLEAAKDKVRRARALKE